MEEAFPRFKAVLLDWRGTLVVAPTYPWLVRRALESLGRAGDTAAVEEVLVRLRAADHREVDSSVVDTDARLHARAYAAWFAAAGIDAELAVALYAAESDVAANDFAPDVGALLATLHRAGVRIGVLSDIHVDLRPVFAAHSAQGGGTWADLVETWTLSFEVGAAKPDPVIFERALRQLGLEAGEVLMVGDRGGHDGAAAAVGMTALVLAPLRGAGERRLQRVVDLVMPGRQLHAEP